MRKKKTELKVEIDRLFQAKKRLKAMMYLYSEGGCDFSIVEAAQVEVYTAKYDILTSLEGI